MMTVTPEAKQRLAEALDQMDEQTPENACFRIVEDENEQLSLSLDVVDEKDMTFEQEDKTVLAIDPAVAQKCENRTLDIDDNGPEGRSVLTLT